MKNKKHPLDVKMDRLKKQRLQIEIKILQLKIEINNCNERPLKSVDPLKFADAGRINMLPPGKKIKTIKK